MCSELLSLPYLPLEKANTKLQLFICLLAFKISQPWKYSVWAFYFWINNVSGNKSYFSAGSESVHFLFHFLLSTLCPSSTLFFFFFSFLGFQLYLIRSESGWRSEESRGEVGRSVWPLEAGGTGCVNATGREWWLPHSVPAADDTVRTAHQKCQLSQKAF